MKAFVIFEPGKGGVTEVEKPVAQPGEVLIKVVANGFCGTDIHTYKGEHPTTYPRIAGHEFAGIVESVGDGVKKVGPGDYVVADPNVFCEGCYWCQQNKQMHCENIEVIGNTRDGAYAEYVTVPERSVFKIKQGSDLVKMSMAEPLACVISAHNKAPVPVGGSVLVFGAGTIGLMHLMLAKKRGAATVTMVDLKQSQLDLAKQLGADHVFLSDDKLADNLKKVAPRGFNMIIEATGVAKVAEFAIPFLTNTGTFIQFGACPVHSTMQVDPQDIYFRELNIIGSYSMQKAMPQSIAMIEDGGLDLAPLIGKVVSIDEFEDTFKEFCAGKTEKKTILKFD